jgi:L-asparaginase
VTGSHAGAEPARGADPVVAILATGGTIQNTMRGRISVRQLLDEVTVQDSEIVDDLPTLIENDSIRVGSEDLEPADWIRIARLAQALADRPDVAGVVVTHGTYTIEETAFFCHLTVDTDKPLVFTCSQRKHGLVGNDGDRNLLDAIRAAGTLGGGVGAVLVAGEEIHSAREVYRCDQRPGGFASGSLGLLGSVELDRVSLYRRPARRHTARSEFGVRDLPDTLPPVEILTTYVGAGDALVSAVRAGGAAGLVLAGFAPAGRPGPGQHDAIVGLHGAGIPVVLTSRGRNGRVPGESEQPAPWLTGDNLSPFKARILLLVALAAGLGGDELQRIFDEY